MCLLIGKSKKKSRNTSKIENEKTTLQKSIGFSKSSSKSEHYGDTGLIPEARKIFSKQPNPTPNRIRGKKKKEKPKLSRPAAGGNGGWEGDQRENKQNIEQKTIENINETKS